MWQILTKICAKEAKCDECGDLICTSGNMFILFKVFDLYLRYFKRYFKILGIVSILYYKYSVLYQIKNLVSPITSVYVCVLGMGNM